MGSTLNSRASWSLPAGSSFWALGEVGHKAEVAYLSFCPNCFLFSETVFHVSRCPRVSLQKLLHPGILGSRRGPFPLNLLQVTSSAPKPGDFGAFSALEDGLARLEGDTLGMGEGLMANFSVTYFQPGKPLEGLRNQTLSGFSSSSFTGNL